MRKKIFILGSYNVDIVSYLDRFPVPGESVAATSSSTFPGGKGANQALAASRAGGMVNFAVKVGQDAFGRNAEKELPESPIASLDVFVCNSKPTGKALIMINQRSGENIITIDLGANAAFTDTDIQSLSDKIGESGYFLTQLENNWDATLKAIQIARDKGTTIILNPAPFSEEIMGVLGLIDIITPNETEAELISGIKIETTADAIKAARKIKSMGVKNVLITLGAKGGVLVNDEFMGDLPIFPAKCVDTTGAGDSFNGAFVARLAAGDPIIDAAIYGSAFASCATELMGASSHPSLADVETRLKSRAV
ncbi:TPA: ribokinase [Klebsiella oxytoca]